MFRSIVVALTLLWLGLTCLMMPDLIRVTASAGNARLEAINRLANHAKPANEFGNHWY